MMQRHVPMVLSMEMAGKGRRRHFIWKRQEKEKLGGNRLDSLRNADLGILAE